MPTKVSDNILKLEGYGVYITVVDKKLFESPINPKTGGPSLDPDDCVEWTEVTEPPNQAFLNLVNAKFETSFLLTDFGFYLSVGDIKSIMKADKDTNLTIH